LLDEWLEQPNCGIMYSTNTELSQKCKNLVHLCIKYYAMNFKEKELIIFDLDGTLIDSMADLATAINKMLLHYNLDPLPQEQVVSYVGNGARNLVIKSLELAMKGIKVPEEMLQEAFDIYLSAYKESFCDKTETYPGVAETLNYLNNKGYLLAICTNKPLFFIEPILEKLSIKQYFKYWIGEDSISAKKPDAAPLLHIISKLESVVEKSIMVGDSKNDILAAKNAGMESIGASYGYNYNESISDYNPTIVVNSFLTLKELF